MFFNILKLDYIIAAKYLIQTDKVRSQLSFLHNYLMYQALSLSLPPSLEGNPYVYKLLLYSVCLRMHSLSEQFLLCVMVNFN